MDERAIPADDAKVIRDALTSADVLLARLEHNARLGDWLQRILSPGATLTIQRRRRRNQWEMVEEFHVEVRGESKQTFVVEVDCLDDAVECHSSNHSMRRCMGKWCKGKLKRLTDFSFHQTGPGGRNRYCKECERRRMAQHREARRKKQKQMHA